MWVVDRKQKQWRKKSRALEGTITGDFYQSKFLILVANVLYNISVLISVVFRLFGARQTSRGSCGKTLSSLFGGSPLM